MSRRGSESSAFDLDAVPFITVDEKDKFVVNPVAIQYLKSISGRIAVVSIAGIYRTGKSYFLNQLMGKSNAFAVGPTQRATTKGIWLWGKGVQVEGSDITILAMDTEGLGSTIRSEDYDVRIFALALLLSSFFIYNSVGTIDGAAISRLSLVVNLTKHIHVRSNFAGNNSNEDSGLEFNQFFPNFLWLVRDFSVKLEKDGRKISSREYLEDALRPEDGISEAIEAKNSVRLLLRNYFPERDCVTLVRPVVDEKQLSVLSELSEDLLRPEFRAQLDATKKKIFTSVKPKTMFGKPLNGSMLASLAIAYVNAINSGSAPTIATAWDRVVDVQCGDAVDLAKKAYVDHMELRLGLTASKTSVSNPLSSGMFKNERAASKNTYMAGTTILDEEDIYQAHDEASTAAIKVFSSHAVQDLEKTPAYEKLLREALSGEFSRYRKSNANASSAYCVEILETLHTLASKRMSQFKLQSNEGAPGGGSGIPSVPLSSRKASRFRRQSNDGNDNDDVRDEDVLRSTPSIRRRQPNTSGVASSSSSIAEKAEASLPDPAKFLRNGAFITATELAAYYRDLLEAIRVAYEKEARGPAKASTFSEYMINRGASLLNDGAAATDSSVAAYSSALQEQVINSQATAAAAASREKSSLELFEQDKKSFQSKLFEQDKKREQELKEATVLLAEKDKEIQRLSDKFDASLAVFTAESVRMDARVTGLMQELKETKGGFESLSSSKIQTLMDLTVMAQRLADAEAERGDADRFANDCQRKLLEESASAAILAERCRAAENETIRLREQTDLLYENVRALKESLVGKQNDLEELEYKFGVASGQVASHKSEMEEVLANLDTMTSLATALKSHVIKSSKGKGLSLDKREQKAYDNLASFSA
jgi:Guanylate-binding protein, N-terminal domain/Guanylate-binding protein, C-terminal domain